MNWYAVKDWTIMEFERLIVTNKPINERLLIAKLYQLAKKMIAIAP